jgi:hypothetical protein
MPIKFTQIENEKGTMDRNWQVYINSFPISKYVKSYILSCEHLVLMARSERQYSKR